MNVSVVRDDVFLPGHGRVARFALVRSAPRRVLVVVPGNPGNARFYVPFMTALAARCPDASVVAFSHRGHGDDDCEGAPLSLAAQIAHASAFVRTIGDAPVTLVGHSIGAHIALAVAADTEVERVVALMPFLARNLDHPVQRVVQRAALRAATAARLLGPLRHLPTSWKARVGRFAGADHDDAAAAIVALFSAGRVHSVLHLAHHELSDLAAPLDVDALAALARAGRLAMVAVPRDVWQPAAQWTALRDAGVPTVVDDTLLHAFCLRQESCVRMAGHVAQLLSSAGAREPIGEVNRRGCPMTMWPAGL